MVIKIKFGANPVDVKIPKVEVTYDVALSSHMPSYKLISCGQGRLFPRKAPVL
ncbi:hypothetical protein CY34DRAFT_798395 [Suillus luteus UH-Slu-Lm8-n1]|uniref:Uncharacterized protein n=1 Tax=Suillus luteus UH-Slu-Lm8-n1 TaxID=930992 RepID=A0A0D0B2P7_9AGAM|nr:hypothetical protein CY34DRAFT_798395 [Suillus luteus UH-Slu-Lm8-n1]